MTEQRTITVGVDQDGRDVEIPIDKLLTGRSFLCGKSGSGKSTTASVFAEELLEAGFPLLIVDTDGEYFGLKERYEVLHAAAPEAENADVTVGSEHGERLAKLALEQNVPIILDVSEFLDQDEADELVLETLRHAFALEGELRKPFLVIVEEVHEYVPQKGSRSDVGDMIIRVAKRGRKRGMGLCGLSQRPASVDKDFITQADLLVWHRLTWDNDLNVVSRVLGSEYREPIQDLENGEAFVLSDWFDDLLRVQFRQKRTYDAGATPGLEDVERPDLKSVGEDLVEELEEISQQESHRQDRIEQLESELESKDERIDQLEADLEDARDLQRLGEAFIDAAEGRGGSGEVDREILEEKNERIRELEDELAKVRTNKEDTEAYVDDLENELEQLEAYRERVEDAERIEERFEALEHWLDQAPDVLGFSDDVDDRIATLREKVASREELIEKLKDELEDARSRQPAASHDDGGLASLIQHEAVQRALDVAKRDSRYSGEHFDRVMAVLANADEGASLSATEIAPLTDVGESSIRDVMTDLYKTGLVERDNSGRASKYRLDRDFLEKRIEVSEIQSGSQA
jgi:predicted  nucleic acid-binding Zn-ribbon protein/adenylate kinase family enzyme